MSTKIFLLFAFLINLNFITAQEFHSIHKEDWQRFGKNIKILNKTNLTKEKILPLDETKVAGSSKTVFGYLPDWEYLNGAHNNLRYDLLTHIAAFDFSVSANGTISNPAGWPWTDVINAAHTNGVKVIMVAVNFDKDEIRGLLTNESYKQNFINNVKAKISTYNLDGVNVDFEGLYAEDRGSRINSFMKALTDSVHAAFPGKEVSFAGPAVNWGGYWNLDGLAASCDYIFIMAYDFFGSWSSNAGPTSPLTGGNYNVTNTVVSQYASVRQSNPQKLILGVPYFGTHFKTSSSAEGAPVTDFVESPRYRSYIQTAATYGELWSTNYKTPWTRWNDGQWHQLWYDNDSSLSLKYDLAIAYDLKGVGMWALNYDGNRTELWNLIDYRFGSGALPPPGVPQDLRIIVQSANTVRVQYSAVQGAAGYKIFKSTDGVNFNSPLYVTGTDIYVNGLSPDTVYYFKVKAYNVSGDSEETETLGALPSAGTDILIVNGFDRNAGTVYNTRNYINKYGLPLLQSGHSFASASNEAVFRGKISLSNYSIVIWILGDESTADETFNAIEQDTVENYLKHGGKFFVSGAEIGWDLEAKGGSDDVVFYHQYLKANYIADAPNGQKATYYSFEPVGNSLFSTLQAMTFDNGTHGTFDVDWPDAIEAINGAENIFKYVNVSTANGYAGISFEGIFPGGSSPGKLVYLAVPFETVYPENSRISLMQKIIEFFEQPVSVDNGGLAITNKFTLYPNYPNPFNPSTVISFNLPSSGNVTLKIYNSLGQTIYTETIEAGAGLYKTEWNGINNYGEKVSSGNYIYTVTFKSNTGKVLRKSGKMTLLK